MPCEDQVNHNGIPVEHIITNGDEPQPTPVIVMHFQQRRMKEKSQIWENTKTLFPYLAFGVMTIALVLTKEYISVKYIQNQLQ